MRFLAKCITAAIMLCAPAVVLPARADISTIKYLHTYINQRWELNIPYTPSIGKNIHDMRYVMTLIDHANLILNGFPTSNYSYDSQYATSHIATTTATRDAVNTLIRKLEPQFFFTPATSSNKYSFRISAAGTYYINWGDGTIDAIEKTDTTAKEYSHTYTDAANNHEISLTGKATAYSTNIATAAISFCDKTYNEPSLTEPTSNAYGLRAMRGCLGCIFSTLDNGAQPRFVQTFAAQMDYTGTIPDGLFAGIQGAPIQDMFRSTFYKSKKLSGTIPPALFIGIQGEPAPGMFSWTFLGDVQLSGRIPEGLFSGIKGAPATDMFRGTFNKCSGLTGAIPPRLFSGIKGAPAPTMFHRTFYQCSGITGTIPEKLFSGIEISVPYQQDMFIETFADCTSLTGPSAKIKDKYLYEIWPNIANQGTYSGANGLSDYDCIPRSWGGLGIKEPGQCEVPPENTNTGTE